MWRAKLNLLAVAVTGVGSVELVRVVSRALRRDKNLTASMRLLVLQMIRASSQLSASLNEYLVTTAALRVQPLLLSLVQSWQAWQDFLTGHVLTDSWLDYLRRLR